MIGLEITGIESIQKKLLQMGEPDLYREVLHDTGDLAYKWLQLLVPVGTGELKASTFLNKTKDGFEIGATAPHAVYNEYGCYNLQMGPAKYKGQRPFVRPSAHRALRDVDSMFKERVSKIWR